MSSMPSNRNSTSSFLFTEAAIGLATFGIVTAVVTTLERQRRRAQAPPIHPQSYPYQPPERIVRYLKDHAGKKWANFSTQHEQFVRECPKVELHVHLDGSLDPDFLWHCLQAYEQRGQDSWISCLPVSTTLPWDAQRPLPVR